MISVKKIVTNVYKKPHLLYAIVALLAGFSFALFTPPFHGPDEDVHFFRAYQIVRGDFVLRNDGAGNLGTCLPSEIKQTVLDASNSPNIRGLTAEKYDIRPLNEIIVDPVDRPDDCEFTSTTNTYSYNPIVYLPALIGVGAVNLFDGPPLFVMYVARLVTVLVATMIFALAIYLIPKRKYLFVVIFLTPMMIYQQSVISIDGLSYAILALFVSYIMRLCTLTEISKKQWVGIGSLTVALCFLKPLLIIFAPLVLLLLRKSKVMPMLLLSLAVIAFVTTAVSTGLIYKDISNVAPEGVNQQQQIEGLVKNPLRSVRVAWNTYMNHYGDEQTQGVIGQFGYADTRLPLWVYTLGVLNIAFALVVSSKADRNSKISKRGRIGVLLLMLIYFAGVNAAMYVAYSPVGYDIFYGVQGRYFLPLLVVLPLIINSGVAISRLQYADVKKYLICSTIVVLMISVLIVFQRYYLFTP